MLEVIVPIFGIVALGFALTKSGIFSAASGQGLTQFMFYVAIPAMLFQAVSSTQLPNQIPWSYWCALRTFFYYFCTRDAGDAVLF